jgi:hypothetical protein
MISRIVPSIATPEDGFYLTEKHWATKVSSLRLSVSVRPEMKHVTSIGYRRPRESGGPGQPFEPCGPWVPAFAGMTDKRLISRKSLWFGLYGGKVDTRAPPLFFSKVTGLSSEGPMLPIAIAAHIPAQADKFVQRIVAGEQGGHLREE